MRKTILIIVSIFVLIFGTVYYFNIKNESVETLSRYGSKGEEVKQIQKKLKEWGYYSGKVDRCVWE